jgi:energy-coupling factor transporter transmembrane protein EcfT
MTEADILHWIRDTWLGATVRESRWIFAAGETLHFIGLSLLVGGILIVDLRLLGFIRRIPVRAALAFLPFVIVGFLINLLTGIVFFSADPMMYWPNPAFKLKMFLILLAGLNALVFTVMAQRQTLSLRDDESAGTLAKVSAGLSLGFWLCVLLLGRLLPAFEGSTSFF